MYVNSVSGSVFELKKTVLMLSGKKSKQSKIFSAHASLPPVSSAATKRSQAVLCVLCFSVGNGKWTETVLF